MKPETQTVKIAPIVDEDLVIPQVMLKNFHEKYGRDKDHPELVAVCMRYSVNTSAVPGECDLCKSKIYSFPDMFQKARKICNICYQEYNDAV